MRPIHRLAPPSSSSIVALATVVVFVLSSLCSVARAGTVQRSYSAGKYALQLGNEASYVRSIDGGNVRGEVVTDPTGNKQIARVVVEPIRAQIDHDDFTQFIQQSLAESGKGQAVDGAIVALDFDGKLISRRDFMHAILTEVSFPEFNAASKDAASMTIALVPESATDFKGGGVPAGIKGGEMQQKKWSPMNFRMKLGDMPTNRVTRIEAIKLTRASGMSNEGIGETRVPEKSAAGSGNWQIPNIVFYLNAVDALPYWKWAEDSLNKGNSGNEQTMTIEALDPTLKEVLLTLTLSGVGLVSAKMEPVAANMDAIRNVRVEVYAEKIALSVLKGPAAAAAPADSNINSGTNAATGTGTGTAAAAGSTSAAPAPGALNAPTAAGEAPAPAPAPRKKRPAPAAVSTAPTLTPLPAPTLTPAPAPAPAPVRKPPPPRG